MNRKNGAQTYYVAYNIWNIQGWFIQYYQALGAGGTLASLNIDAICKSFNIPVPKAFNIMDFLAALAFIFGLISPSGYGSKVPYLGEKRKGFEDQIAAEYLLRAVQNSPTLSRNLLQTGDLSDTQVQVAAIQSMLAEVISQMETNIQAATLTVQSNYTVFLDFVRDGTFSAPLPSLDTVRQNLTLALNTFVVSQALQADKVIITQAIDTNVDKLQRNGSAAGFDTGCGKGYNSWGMCSNWFYDADNNISFGLMNTKDTSLNYTNVLMSAFASGITTPQLLFQNSAACALASNSTQGNAPGTGLKQGVGVWNTQCISNLKVCTWGTTSLDIDKEFTDCPSGDSFVKEGCGQGTDINQALVPSTYLGAWLTSGSFEGIVCNKPSKGSLFNPT